MIRQGHIHANRRLSAHHNYDWFVNATWRINDHSFGFLKGKCKASGSRLHGKKCVYYPNQGATREMYFILR